MSGWTCAECALAGRRGYCAPLRCYCGHPTCHAVASWTPLPEPAHVEPAKSKSDAWANRKESTWIDQL